MGGWTVFDVLLETTDCLSEVFVRIGSASRNDVAEVWISKEWLVGVSYNLRRSYIWSLRRRLKSALACFMN